MHGQLLGVFLLLCDKGASNRQTEQCICCQGCTYDKVLVRASVTIHKLLYKFLKLCVKSNVKKRRSLGIMDALYWEIYTGSPWQRSTKSFLKYKKGQIAYQLLNTAAIITSLVQVLVLKFVDVVMSFQIKSHLYSLGLFSSFNG